MKRPSLNHTYRLIWNDLTQAWVAVAERTRARGKRGGAVAAILLAVGGPAHALDNNALPTGGTISAGQGNIATSGSTMTVMQGSTRMVADWSSYNIGKNATVTYVQPSTGSIALNRIASTSPSQIFGHLNANGQVWLLNSAGIVFGQSAQVDVGGLVASSFNMSNDDFLAGKSTFSGNSSAGSIVNQGHLKGKVIALIGPSVKNSGSISATNGAAVLAAGEQVSLDFTGDGLINVTVDKGALKALAENSGSIEADGGLVVLTAKSADTLTQSAVNNTGVIRARTLANKEGHIELMGDMQSGTVNVSGTLDASAPVGGNGGFIETSAAHVKVADGAKITTKAASGQSGTWLIDPDGFTIAASGGDMTGTTLSSSLSNGNVSIWSNEGSGSDGNINVNDTVSWSTNTLTLHATNDIHVNATLDTSNHGDSTAGLALEYGQGAAASGNAAAYYIAPGAKINLDANGSFSTKLGSDGSTINYTIITDLGMTGSTTGADLQGIQANLSGKFVLGSDIDASATSGWSEGFNPIGSLNTDFTGIFDGLGHTVDHLAINRTSSDFVGLFGHTSLGASIRNLGLTNASVSGTGPFSGSNNYVGGLVGYNRGDIYNSYVSGSVTGLGASGDGMVFVGGLAGYNQGSIRSSYAITTVSGTGGSGLDAAIDSLNDGGSGGPVSVGGLVGFNEGGSISGSFAAGQVSATGGRGGNGDSHCQDCSGGTGGSAIAGGLTGYNENANIVNSYASVNVTAGGGAGGEGWQYPALNGAATAGGLVGSNSGTVNSSYSLGTVSGYGGMATTGGLLGSSSGAVNNSFWNTQTSGMSNSAGGSGAVGKTTAQMRTLATFTGANWDIDDAGGTGTVWRIYDGYTAPLLRGFMIPLNLVAFDGSGTAMTNIAYTIPAGADSSKILGSTISTVLTLSSTQAGSYSASADIKGLYSSQLGYDIGGSRTISTPGSAAGDIHLTNAVTWTSGTLAIDTSGTVTATGDISGTGSAVFNLKNGTWSQVGSTLPAFDVYDFRISGGTFIRAFGGDGGSATPYQLADIYGVQGIGSSGMQDKQYLLANDIDATGTSYWNDGAGFVPVGAQPNAFNGTFNGQNHVIDGLTINRSTTNYQGLFGLIERYASVSDVGLTNANITGQTYVGGLVGYSRGKVSNTYVDGTVTGTKGPSGRGNNVGGLVGYNDNNDSGHGSISDSHANATVNGGDNVGGLVGYNDMGTFSNTYATGTVKGNNKVGGLVGFNVEGSVNSSHATSGVDGGTSNAGGLVGSNLDGTVSHSYATGNVRGDAAGLGGLVGYNTGTVSDSYASGNVTGGDNTVGGLVGGNEGTVNSSYATGAVTGFYYVGGLVGSNTGGTVSDSYATGGVKGFRSYVGGLVGVNLDGNLKRSYASGTVTSSYDGALIGGLVGSNGGTGLLENSYATGAVTHSGDFGYVGGLVGKNYGTINMTYATGLVTQGDTHDTAGGLVAANYGTVSSSFWDTQATGLSGSAGGTGKTTAEMHTLSTFVDAGWDIDDAGGTGKVWRIYEGNTAPLLRNFLTPITITAKTGSRGVDGTTNGLGVIYSTTPNDHLLGTAAVATSSPNAGSYTVKPTGLYSDQQGYDLVAEAGVVTITGGSANSGSTGTLDTSSLTSRQTGINGTGDNTSNQSAPGSQPVIPQVGPGAGSQTLAQGAPVLVADNAGFSRTATDAGSGLGIPSSSAVPNAPGTSGLAFGSNGGGVTLTLGNEITENPVAQRVLPVFVKNGGDIKPEGNYDVEDHIGRLNVKPVGANESRVPTDNQVGRNAKGAMKLANGGEVKLSVTLSSDGVLAVDLPPEAANMSPEQAMLLGVALARQQLDVGADALTAVVIRQR